MAERRSNDATGMAGEFFVMEILYRLGHQPALTIGKAKSIDILVRAKKGNLYEVSVKAVCGGGKWGVGMDDHSLNPNRIFVFLHYRSFEDIYSNPNVFVVPSAEVEKMKMPWFDQHGLYFTNEKLRNRLEPYRDAWDQYFV